MRKEVKKGLRELGRAFTRNWASNEKDLGDYEIFATSAERCLRITRRWDFLNHTILFCAAIILFLPIYWAIKTETLPPGSIQVIRIVFTSSFILGLIAFFLSRKKPEEIYFRIATAWKEVRKYLIVSKTAQKVGEVMLGKPEYFPEIDLKELVSRHLSVRRSEIIDEINSIDGSGSTAHKLRKMARINIRSFHVLGCDLPEMDEY